MDERISDKATKWLFASLFGLCIIILYRPGKAQVDTQQKIITIAEAKKDSDNNFLPDEIGKRLTVSGRATVSSGVLSIDQLQVTVQDRTGGILIFSPDYKGPQVHAGDSLIVTGTLTNYFGLTELDNPNIIFADTLKRKIPVPVTYNYDEPEKYEGQLVTLTGRIINKGNQSSGDYLLVAPVEGSDISIKIYNSKYHKFPGILQKFNVGEIIRVNGIVTQHDNQKIPNGFYEIVPTSPSDIVFVRHNLEYYLLYIIGIIGIALAIIIHNIWLQRKVARRTRKLNESLRTNERFISIMSHDIRSPLSGVLSLSEVMAEETKDQPDQSFHKYSVAIHNSVNSTLQMLNNLLEWSKMRTGKTSVTISEFDLNELIDSTFSYYYELVRQKDLSLKNLLDQSLIMEADKNMINTVLRNFISNAIKFTDKGGKITANAKKTHNKVVFEVTDTGHGMTPEQQELLFSPKKYEEGQGGLGLMLCKEMVKKLRGTISVSSKLNEGTTFSVSIPQKH